MYISKPRQDQLNEYYRSYWELVPESDLMKALHDQSSTAQAFINSISEEQAGHRYAPGKWSVREVIGHLCDTERILVYRALCFARAERNPLPGFDENLYMEHSNFEQREFVSIRNEWKAVREASIAFFSNLSEEMPDRMGIANNSPQSVRNILYFLIAHERHHLNVIREKYL